MRFGLISGRLYFHLISPLSSISSGDSYPAIFYASPFIIIALVGMVVWAVRKFRDERELILFGSLFFLVNIALLLQIVSVGVAIMAERYTYMAYIGIFFTCIVLLSNYLRKNTAKQNIYVPAILSAYVIFFGVFL